MNRNAEIKIRNRYKLVRRDADLNVIEESGWSENLMTLEGFDVMLGVGERAMSCAVGAGNTPPDEDDEYLESWVRGTNALQANAPPLYSISSSPRHVKWETLWRFNPSGSPYNASEVGITIGPVGASTERLASRALVVDESDNPTTVSVLGDEYLDVYWELFVYVPEDFQGMSEMEDDGVPVNTDYVVRGARMTGSSWPTISTTSRWLPAFSIVTGNTPGSSSGAFSSDVMPDYGDQVMVIGAGAGFFGNGTAVPQTFTPRSKTRNWKLTLQLGSVNFTGGIGGIVLGLNSGHVYMTFDPKINKTSTKVGELDFSISVSNV